MARKSKPWFREARGQWYVQHKGRQVPLGPEKEEAHRRWHNLMALSGVNTAGDANPFQIIADEFLDWIKRNKKAKTYKTYRHHLEAFCSVHGKVAVRDLKPHHVDGVLKQHPDWTKSTIRGFMVCVSTTLNWSARLGYTTHNPLSKKLDIPKIVSRGKDSLVSPADYKAMIEHANPRLRDFLVACRNSGTRPHIVATVEARHFHEATACWVMDEHKTADESGEPLVVHLNPTLLALTKKLIAENPVGPIFRNNRGNVWTDTAWGKAMEGLRKTLRNKDVKLEGRGIMYGFRHTFATDLLEKGVPDAHAAALLGHKSTTMIHKHYSHLSSKTAALKVHLQHIGGVPGEDRDAGAVVQPDQAPGSVVPVVEGLAS